MNIGQRLIAGFVGIAMLVAVVGAIAVQQQLAMAEVAAIAEATHVAEGATYSITYKSSSGPGIELYHKPADLEQFVARMHDLQSRDIVVVDTQKRILADAIPENIGTIFDHDAANQIAQTIRDGSPRTFVETSVDYPAGIKQLVVPLKDAEGIPVGAVILEYTALYDEMSGYADATIQIIVIASIICLLLAILLGYLISRTISNPIKQLTRAMGEITTESLDRTVPVQGSGELRQLGQAFNQMSGQLRTAQQRLKDWNQTLERTVAERTTQLMQTSAEAEAARATAEQANQMKSQFLANMSHELRTPLNSIINFTRILLAGTRGPVTESQADYLTRVRHSGEHLLGLINDILDLSKIEAGRMELIKEPLAIDEVVQGVLATASGLTKDKPITLIQNLDPNLPLIYADRTRVRQIMLNLLSNAAKFTDQGEIAVRVAQADTHMIVSVTDSGIGIPAEYLTTIFEEFRQVDSDSDRAYGGTGLGLAISRRFVEMHGGKLWVESTVGVGSTFSFSLPLIAVPARETAPAPVPPALVEQDGPTVLVIDDDPAAIEIVHAYLQQDGYRVVGIGDSRRALEQARMIDPVAIILDVFMPHKDGWEILAELKADPNLALIPVILYTIADEQRLGYHLGANAYLLKPIDEQHLRATLGQLVAPSATIVVIDDEPDALEITTRQLDQIGGHRIVTAGDGRTGLARIAETQPDMIILDLMMPGVDGFMVLDELKSNPQTADIPVVVLTAKDLTTYERTWLSGQVSGLLTKDQISTEQLLGTLRKIVTSAAKSVIVTQK